MSRCFILMIWLLLLYTPIISCSQNDSEPTDKSDIPQQKTVPSATKQQDKTASDLNQQLKSLRQVTAELSNENQRMVDRQASVEAKLVNLARMMKGKHEEQNSYKMLETLQGAEEFLSKAKKFEKTDPRLAELYYLGGINRLADKRRGIKLFFVWMEKRINQDLNKKDYRAATNKVDQLAHVLNENFYQDQIETVPDYAQFYRQLDNFSNMIYLHKKKVTEKQKIQLSGIEKNLRQFDHRNLEKYKRIYKQISAINPESEEIQTKARILLSKLDLFIKASQACLFPGKDNLVLPPTEIPEAFEPWLVQLQTYMKNQEIPVSKRIKIWRETSYLLSEFDYNKDPELVKQAQGIESTGRYLQAADWIKRSRLFENQHLTAPYPTKHQLADAFILLQEGERHFQSNPDLIRPAIKQFGAGYFESLKNNIATNCQELYNTNFKASVKIQINAAFLSQSFQVYLDLTTFIKTYGNNQELLSVKDRIETLITGLTTYEASQRALINANEKEKLRIAEERFIIYARKHIDEAWQVFKEAEKSAEKLTETWGSEKNQKSLKKGLNSLYTIDRNSLNLVDPGMMDEWKRVEWLLKREYKGQDNEAAEAIYARTKKKRLEDFE